MFPTQKEGQGLTNLVLNHETVLLYLWLAPVTVKLGVWSVASGVQTLSF